MARDIDAALAELGGLNRAELARRWTATFGSQAPTRCRSQLLRSALAWHIQAKTSVTTRDAHGARRRIRMRSVRDANRPRAGTVLVREWNGMTHRVTVLSDGYQYAGSVHRSLSAIARAITGTNWSGRRFFGLKA